MLGNQLQNVKKERIKCQEKGDIEHAHKKEISVIFILVASLSGKKIPSSIAQEIAHVPSSYTIIYNTLLIAKLA